LFEGCPALSIASQKSFSRALTPLVSRKPYGKPYEVRAKGADHVPLAVLLAGLLQLLAGKARVGKYIRIVPLPVRAVGRMRPF
jgi:MFS superfamily sulfate permease-like transporter